MQKVIIFSAPSGSGKTTVVKHLLQHYGHLLAFSISATTRKIRPNEIDGKDYYFYEYEKFNQLLEADAFVEYEQVYKGLYYGTLKSEIERIWKDGKAVLFDVDVKGGINLKKIFKNQALSVFLKPPSIEILMERLTKRSTEVEHQLIERIAKAKEELKYESFFDYVIINNVLSETFYQAEQQVLTFINNK